MEWPVKGDASAQLVAVVTDVDDYLGLSNDFLGQIKMDMASLIEECNASQAAGEKKLVKTVPLLDMHFKCSGHTATAVTMTKFVTTAAVDKNRKSYFSPAANDGEKKRMAKQLTDRRATGHEWHKEAPRGTIELHFLWQPHTVGTAASETEHAIRMGGAVELAAVHDRDRARDPIEENPTIDEPRSVGYLQDMSHAQLQGVECGMRVMV
jgi:hypothetical protein